MKHLKLICQVNANDCIDISNDDCTNLLHIGIGEVDIGVHNAEVLLTADDEYKLFEFLWQRQQILIKSLSEDTIFNDTVGTSYKYHDQLVTICTHKNNIPINENYVWVYNQTTGYKHWVNKSNLKR